MSTIIPTMQKAAVITTKGALPVVQSDFPVPTPGAGEVLVRLEAAALNPIDCVVQQFGLFVDTYPAVIGCDGAGVVVALGEGVEGEGLAVFAGGRATVSGRADAGGQG